MAFLTFCSNYTCPIRSKCIMSKRVFENLLGVEPFTYPKTYTLRRYKNWQTKNGTNCVANTRLKHNKEKILAELKK